MDNLKPLRWGIIGCGNVTEVKSGPPYKNTKGFELSMVMRRNAEKAADYAKRHQVPFWTTNASKVIENPKIDAVYIATPPDTHKLYGLLVAAAGKPCCIEKPMAPCYADSLEIYNAFQKNGIPLFIAYYRRSLPRFNKVKEWLDKGLIGDVRHIRWYKSRTPSELDLSGTYNWRTDAKIAPAGYFDDLASHGLDLFTYLLGNIKDAKGFAVNQQGLYSAKDAVTGSWLHENGITGEGSWIFGANEQQDKVEIFGSKGEIRFSVLNELPIELISPKLKESLIIEHPKHLHRYHVENIQKHLSGIAQHPSTGATGLHTSWVMDKILGN
ncbi:2-hydroxy-4-carboxymuconate semialdehyde hemiacetal dehydrogenase [Flagellimonas maritima]|uniref:2-hydroxy-4-carboxymuconate semialdehyde hemiacetal dehydrogenase n=1 Tax=Flagellimonas maritima TaxID=1383885 RepID=A0A2Z4LQN1_9FLAO|nr:Gfo/Idh/MocA family oxidoreductase [Allomuricauda aurantiaca]AWX44155.1 2-hydroxy-4-carboxymuconate semialdehyde hemiacetal dehydrogenase [Allomuricauda aurantiaca]